MESQNYNIIVDQQSALKRLDVYLCEYTQKTRSFIKTLIDTQKVLLDGKNVQKAGTILKIGQIISLQIPPEQPSQILSKDIPISILYQDQDIAIIDKPQGLTTHPSNGHLDDTLVNALLYHLDHLSTINGEVRPGIVHRLDKDTSGVMVVAKTNQAHLSLSKQFENRTVKKKYYCVVDGYMQQDKGTINVSIGRHKTERKKMAVVENGRFSTTKYKLIEKLKKSCFIECEILTGRTHQIRVHMAHLGHPIVGDIIYGSQKQCKNQLLHSHFIQFEHPISGIKMKFEAPLPNYFEDFLKKNRIQ